MSDIPSIKTSCCIAGGGPAGMMLGFLFARAGVEVIVLEKHKDFFRDFRGDTIHPSTFQLMHELGILDEFLKVPHQEIDTLTAIFNTHRIKMVDFSHLDTTKPVLGLMPQWDFLNFIAGQASRYPTFSLQTNTEATDIITEGGKIRGVKARRSDGSEMRVHTELVIAADGRKSILREKAGLTVIDTGAPIDVLWFKLSLNDTDPAQTFGNFHYGKMLIMLNRETYWQCAYVINKNGLDDIKKQGLDNLKKDLSEVSPFISDRLNEIQGWDDLKLLSVAVDHLEKWYKPGLLCIGDAAHAMSPVGGVGINLAIQDAVAAANALYKPLLSGAAVPDTILHAVQKRREFPTRVIQIIQVNIQKGIHQRREKATEKTGLPLAFRLMNVLPVLRRIPAWLVGKGIRPEHIKTPDIHHKL